MCVGCREMKPKIELVRIVKSADGEIKLDLAYENGTQKVILNGEDVSDLIRTPEISMYASITIFEF